MPIDEKLDSLRVAKLANSCVKSFVLRCITRCLSTINLGAWIGRSTTRVSIPIGLPVAIDITSEASLIRCVGRRRLPVLTPQTIISLTENKALG